MSQKGIGSLLLISVVVVIVIVGAMAFLLGSRSADPSRISVEHFDNSNPVQKPLEKMTQETKVSAAPSTTTLANPASVNCAKQGGTLTIATRGDGGQYGICNFEDDQACEEWALYRGDCPVGGIKTIGFDTQPEVYCALIGGQTLAVSNPSCKLPNGHTCSDTALYNGQCE